MLYVGFVLCVLCSLFYVGHVLCVSVCVCVRVCVQEKEPCCTSDMIGRPVRAAV